MKEKIILNEKDSFKVYTENSQMVVEIERFKPNPEPTDRNWPDFIDYRMPLIGKEDSSETVKFLNLILGLKEAKYFAKETHEKVVEFQKDNSLEADGLVGKNTWNAIFKSLLPEFDPSKPLKQRIVDICWHYSKFKMDEYDQANNFFRWPLFPVIGSENWAWCASTVNVVYALAINAIPKSHFDKKITSLHTGWVGGWNKWSKYHGIRRHAGSYTPMPGDGIIFDWGDNGSVDHIGFFIEKRGDKYLCIEGNTQNRFKLAERNLSTIEYFIDWDEEIRP